MLLDQNTVRLIFGLKLKNLRQQHQYSLKELGQKTGLSVSYLNEIEKGKKYPKPDKVLALADALSSSFDQLVSVRLEEDQDAIARILQNGFVHSLPLQDLGINLTELLNSITEDSQKATRLLCTILELRRRHFIRQSDLFSAILKSEIDEKRNHFTEWEELASTLRDRYRKWGSPSDSEYAQQIVQHLEQKYNYEFETVAFGDESTALRTLRFRRNVRSKKIILHLNSALSAKEQLYFLLRELIARELGHPPISAHQENDDFATYTAYVNHYMVSYIADAMLLPKDSFLDELNLLCSFDRWSSGRFRVFLQNAPVPTKRVLQRMTQLLPREWNIDPVYALEFGRNIELERFLILDELHLSGLQMPNGINREESFCRRWISMRALEAFTSSKDSSGALIQTQKSTIADVNGQFFNIAIAERDSVERGLIRCHTIGIPITKKHGKRIAFLNDTYVKHDTVAETCERCRILDCKERLAPNTSILDPWLH